MQNVIEQANQWVSEWPANRCPRRLMTKCYGPDNCMRGRPYKGESDV